MCGYGNDHQESEYAVMKSYMQSERIRYESAYQCIFFDE